jgi:hypothetical protein
LGDLIVDGRIKIAVKEIVYEGVEGSHMAQDGDRWQAVVNMVINYRVPHKRCGMS